MPTPTVDRDQFLEQGYVIIRGLIPPDQLRELRAMFDRMFLKQAEVSGEAWKKSSQRRVNFSQVVDESTAGMIDFCLGPMLEVGEQLSQAPMAPTILNSLCDPASHLGPSAWHRDLLAGDEPFVDGVQHDRTANRAVSGCQWNVALYDDPVLWFVPGSQARPNTPEEDRRLREAPLEPMPYGIPVELAAGDGVVYTPLGLHWGSSYSVKRKRRTIHVAYRAFGTPIFPYLGHLHWDLEFSRHLSPESRATLERAVSLNLAERDLISRIFRAAIERDRPAFEAALAELHPGTEARMVAVALLTSLVGQVALLKSAEVAALSAEEQSRKLGTRLANLPYWSDLAAQFTPAEVEQLGQRWSYLAEQIKADVAPGAKGQGNLVRHHASHLPGGVDLESFFASWQ